MKHVVMFSGGLGSFAAAARVIEKHGKEDVVLLFTDTLVEDRDLYTFLDEASAYLGIPITRIAEGRTPWEVFNDKRMIGNSRLDPCSQILKRMQGDKWLEENCDPLDTVVYLGIDWTESHRFDDGNGRGARNRYAKLGWRCQAPLIDPPYLNKEQITIEVEEAGIAIPRLYTMGFAHNNCGGFCIKAGQDHFAMLYDKLPEVYAANEKAERDFNIKIGSKTERTVLRDRRNKTTKPLSLGRLRRRIEAGKFIETGEIGGCGCFIDE